MSNEESEAAQARREIDELESSADVLTAKDSHGEAPTPPRLLRGRVAVRELEADGLLWTPPANPRQVKTHRGVVLGMGPPALMPRVWTRSHQWEEPSEIGFCVCKHCGAASCDQIDWQDPPCLPHWGGGHEVPHGFKVGDVVQYHFEHHQEAWTMTWIDGKPCTYLAQHNVDAVIE